MGKKRRKDKESDERRQKTNDAILANLDANSKKHGELAETGKPIEEIVGAEEQGLIEDSGASVLPEGTDKIIEAVLSNQEDYDYDKLINNFKRIEDLCDFKAACERHPILMSIKDLFIELNQVPLRDSAVANAKVETALGIAEKLDGIKEQDSSTYKFIKWMCDMTLEAGFKSWLYESSKPLIQYTKLLVTGVKNPDKPEFKDGPYKELSREIFGFVEQVAMEYRQRMSTAINIALKEAHGVHEKEIRKLTEIKDKAAKVHAEYKQMVSAAMIHSLERLGLDHSTFFEHGEAAYQKIEKLALIAEKKGFISAQKARDREEQGLLVKEIEEDEKKELEALAEKGSRGYRIFRSTAESSIRCLGYSMIVAFMSAVGLHTVNRLAPDTTRSYFNEVKEIIAPLYPGLIGEEASARAVQVPDTSSVLSPEEQGVASYKFADPQDVSQFMKDGQLYIPDSIDGVLIDNVKGYWVHRISPISSSATFNIPTEATEKQREELMEEFRKIGKMSLYKSALDMAKGLNANGFIMNEIQETKEGNKVTLESRVFFCRGKK